MVMLKLSDLEQVLRDNNGVTLLPPLLRLLASAGVEVKTPPDAEADPVGSFRKYDIDDLSHYYVKQNQDSWVRLGAARALQIPDISMAATERVTADEVQSAFITAAEFWDADGDHWVRTSYGRYVIHTPRYDTATYTADSGHSLDYIIAGYGPIRFTP